MRFLVLGCNGMAGHMISLYLKEQGHDVLGFALNKSKFIKTVTGDALDGALIKELIGKNRFDTIVNCIGLLNKACDVQKATAVYLNSYFPHQLAELTEGTSTQVIHMSTDCVFDGGRGQYTENDYPDGTTFYDRTKALGELNNGKDLTLRQSIVGPDINKNGIGLLNWFMQQQEKVAGYKSVQWTGQTTLQLAKTMEMAANERVAGLYNMVPDTSISKYDLLCLFNRYIRKCCITIEPDYNVISDKSLKRTCWDFSYKIPNYETMIVELADWMRQHKEFYPHYNL